MTDYARMEFDFIRRTLEIIDQYEELVRGHVDYDHEYEVTLLMNCLLGLLIYPQQIAHRGSWQDWLNQKLQDSESQWGLSREMFRSVGYLNDNRTKIGYERLTVRNLIRQMRNTAAHARFYVGDRADNRGQISEIVFKDEEREDGFHLVIPVVSLEKFVRRLAQSAIEQMGG